MVQSIRVNVFLDSTRKIAIEKTEIEIKFLIVFPISSLFI